MSAALVQHSEARVPERIGQGDALPALRADLDEVGVLQGARPRKGAPLGAGVTGVQVLTSRIRSGAKYAPSTTRSNASDGGATDPAVGGSSTMWSTLRYV